MKEDQNGPKSRETIPGLGYSKNSKFMFNDAPTLYGH